MHANNNRVVTDFEQRSLARIAINVESFPAPGNGGIGGVNAKLVLQDTAGGRVRQVDELTIEVARGAVSLQFFVDATDLKLNLVPIGIGFKGNDNQTLSRDPLGSTAFPTRNVLLIGNTALLDVLDNNTEVGEFKFNVLIQRVDNGDLGVLDPKIRNRGVGIP